MQGFHFYAEMPDDRVGKHASRKNPRQPLTFMPWTRATLKALAASGQHVNVTAAYVGSEYVFHDGQGARREAIAALYDWTNSAVATTAVDPRWLRERCTRIDEATARKLHPALFSVLDQPE